MSVSLKEKAYCYIKGKIVDCEYLPGQVLVEAELMKNLNASRTPIREALNKLEQENLVRILPKRGVFVCDLTMSDVNQVFEVRELIEPYIIREYGNLLSPEALLLQRSKIEKRTVPQSSQKEYYRDDDDLHKMLLNASDNRYLFSLMNTIYAQNHRLRIISGLMVESRLAETQKEHLLICDFLLKGNIEAATAAMLEHLQNSKNAAVKAMLSGKNLPLTCS